MCSTYVKTMWSLLLFSSMNKVLAAKWVVLLIICVSINNGDGLTSSFKRKDAPSTDIPLDSEILAPPKGYNAPEQVHITQGDYDGKAVIISWVTPHELGSSTVYYGKSKSKYSITINGTVTSYSFNDYKSGFIYHCLVDGLQYNTKYYYKIGSGPTSRKFWFRTPPEIGPDSSYTFGIIGDLGQTNNSLATLQHYMQSEGLSVLFLGDLSYADRYKDFANSLVGLRWDTWGRLVEPSNAYQPWIWSAGNHDVEYFPSLGLSDVFKQYNTRYPTPYMASGSNDPLWYAIRRASAHIIVLSSYSGYIKYSPQWRWLQAEFQKVDREKTPWLIVVLHVPLYNSNAGHYMEGEGQRSVFEQSFIDNKVDVVFAGHVHSYERSHRVSNVKYNISNGACSPMLDEAAPLYINVGDGGNSEGLAAEYLFPQPNYSAFREASYGHAILDIKNRTHAYYHWNRNDDGNKVTADSVLLLNQFYNKPAFARPQEF